MPGNEQETQTMSLCLSQISLSSENLLRVLVRNRNWTKATERLVGFAQFPVATKKAKKPDMFCEPCDWFWCSSGFWYLLIHFSVGWYLLVQHIGGWWFAESKWWFIKSTFEENTDRGCHIAVLNGTRAVKPYNLGVWFFYTNSNELAWELVPLWKGDDLADFFWGGFWGVLGMMGREDSIVSYSGRHAGSPSFTKEDDHLTRCSFQQVHLF